MKISWVLANSTSFDPEVDLDQLKNIGSFWGGWRTWRGCHTDNVICNETKKAAELVRRAFHAVCNLYVPRSVYDSLERPAGVKVFEGEFDHDVDDHDNIVAMHLAATVSDIVLLYGFDFTEQPKNSDKLAEHKSHNYRGLTKQVILDNPTIQWVAVDHSGDFRKDLLTVANLSKDSMQSVIELLGH